jgi:excinuclease ABC subunit A
LNVIQEAGLGYIRLGQPATTLSGGEAQRVKLATELGKRFRGNALYLLDEPTTGLHYTDVKKLLVLLHKLVDQGNSVLLIEHNLDVLASSDYLIDLGPEGGVRGGRVIAKGTPEQIARSKAGYTGAYLREYFKELNR